MGQTVDTFHESLKPLAVEEFLDYYFYRRVAHRMVPVLARLGLTPNQVTTLSLGFGLAAAYGVWTRHFLAATLLAVIAIFFDCCDGQLARLTKTANPIGRAMDGTFDMIWVTCLWLAIFFSRFLQDAGYPRILLLMIPSSLSMILHCWRFDAIKLKTLECAGEPFSEGDLDFDQSLAVFKNAVKSFNPITSLIAFCMVFQMYFFVRGKDKKRVYQHSPASQARVKALFDPVLDRCSWIGEGHHNTLVLLGLLLAPLTPVGLIGAFWFILVPMNLWWLKCEFDFARAMREVAPILADLPA